jgi:glyoxylase-like metal-dependent hydrolase (beta-lactamase superfamily II)
VSGAFERIRVGGLDIARIEELRIPNRIAYFTQDTALVDAHRHWLAPHFLDPDGMFDLVFQSFVFEHAGRIVLVDPCTGNGIPHPVPFFDRLDTPWIERIAEAGYRPEDVDFVVCTHLHHDHCGWNKYLRDGRWVPTFPNARYILNRSEVQRWGDGRAAFPERDYNIDVYERSVLPVLEAGLADIIGGQHPLAAGMLVEPAPGHTIGHQVLHVNGEGIRATFTGDAFHHPIQLVQPDIDFGGCDDLPATIATRIRLREAAADLGAVLIPAHVCAPYGIRAWREAGQIRLAAAA